MSKTRADYEAEGWVFDEPRYLTAAPTRAFMWMARATKKTPRRQTLIAWALEGPEESQARLMERLADMTDLPPDVTQAMDELGEYMQENLRRRQEKPDGNG